MAAGEQPVLDRDYWEGRWQQGQTGWDIGAPSPPLTAYFDQLKDKSIAILIPGCGNAWEGEYLHRHGFTNVYLLDLAPTVLGQFAARVPSFPREHLLTGDFFTLEGKFDLIVEQTFFCAISPEMRQQYAEHAYKLLNPGGQLVGLLFQDDFGKHTPPYGGEKEEYLGYFEPLFRVRHFETAYNSIKPRAGRELFMNLVKR